MWWLSVEAERLRSRGRRKPAACHMAHRPLTLLADSTWSEERSRSTTSSSWDSPEALHRDGPVRRLALLPDRDEGDERDFRASGWCRNSPSWECSRAVAFSPARPGSGCRARRLHRRNAVRRWRDIGRSRRWRRRRFFPARLSGRRSPAAERLFSALRRRTSSRPSLLPDCDSPAPDRCPSIRGPRVLRLRRRGNSTPDR